MYAQAYRLDMDLYELRRQHLLRLIAGPRFSGSQAAFSEATGISRSYVTRMLKEPDAKDSKRIGDDMAMRIEAALDLPAGEMLNPSGVREPYKVYSVEPGPASRGRVPLISWVAAGGWNGAEDPLSPGDAERWLECPASHSPRSYALRVRGDSMTAAFGRSYPEGCIIFVDPTKKSPVNGQRIIAKLEGTDEVTFKVFKQEDGRVWLAPLNPSHQPIRDEFKVLGTVIGKWEDE